MKPCKDVGERISQYKRLYTQAENDSSEVLSQWKDLSDFILPTKGKYLSGGADSSKENEGNRKPRRIINSTATQAVQILASGMLGGLTSPSRPWFVLGIEDEELMEFGPVKVWLHDVRRSMLGVLQKSNFYGSMHGLYRELGTFGSNAMLMDEDFETVIRFRPTTAGEFRIVTDAAGRVTGLFRKFNMQVGQIVDKFGIDVVSEAVKSAYKNKNYFSYYPVINVIHKNEQCIRGSLRVEHKAYISVYFEANASNGQFLDESGADSPNFVGPRWDVTPGDVYGYGPGHTNLGDIRMLQKLEEKKLKALDKMVDPPMNAPTDMKGKGGTIIAGGVNYVDTKPGQQAFTPVYQIRPDMQNIAFEIDRVERRIDKGFYADLFNAIIGTDKTMTATEISERHNEKMMQLGPIIERLQAELLDPVIDRTFSLMMDRGMIPEPPEELQGREFKIEYVSLLAQAQRAVGTSSIEQTAAFVGSLSAVSPDVIDKMDFDEAVDQYADALGVPPKVIRSDDQVAEIRAQRAQQQAAVAQQQQNEQNAQTAKVLSETEVNDENALGAILGG